MRVKKSRIVLLTLGIIVLGYAGYAGLKPDPEFVYEQRSLPDDFMEYHNQLLNRDSAIGVREGNEEKLVRAAQGKTDYAILYIHGFGASREEGSYITDRVAAKLKANLYYARLPGHGTTKEDHRDRTYAEYLQYAGDTMRMMNSLGNKTILIGTSMGGLIATWLAATFPEQTAALVLASPFYDFASPSADIMKLPGGMSLVNAVYGEVRESSGKANPDYGAGYEKYWYTQQYFSSLQNLVDLRAAVLHDDTIARVRAPVLMTYYYRDDEHQDPTASVPAMLEVFEKFGQGQNSFIKQKAPIANGNHVMLSEHVKTDKETIEKTIVDFLQTNLPEN